MRRDHGVFTLSLDFELIWGTLDHGPEAFSEACERERTQVVGRLLALFEEFEIPATWCVLGHLLLESCEQRNGLKHPEIVQPRHAWVQGDWFAHDPCGTVESDPIFYGRSLVESIRSCRVRQEIGCHSFSHPIFGDPGCTRATAETELAECARLASGLGIGMRAFAFPRNRVGHLQVLRENGYTVYRGPEPVWYEAEQIPGPLRRLGHLVDVLAARRPPVVVPQEVLPGLWNLPGSMIYFPFHGFRRYVPMSLRVRRAMKGLDRAVRTGKVFHLWFHPTNLAYGTEPLFAGLREILARVAQLRTEGRLCTLSMSDTLDYWSGSSTRPAGAGIG